MADDVANRLGGLEDPSSPPTSACEKAAGVDADYFLLDSDYGHSASGRDAHKWAPRLREFMESLV